MQFALLLSFLSSFMFVIIEYTKSFIIPNKQYYSNKNVDSVNLIVFRHVAALAWAWQFAFIFTNISLENKANLIAMNLKGKKTAKTNKYHIENVGSISLNFRKLLINQFVFLKNDHFSFLHKLMNNVWSPMIHSYINLLCVNKTLLHFTKNSVRQTIL